MATPAREALAEAPNGAALASFLAAGIGAFALGAIVILNELDVLAAPSLYAPAGGVTGRTTLGVAAWLIAWALLHRRWRNRAVRPQGVYAATLILVGLGVLLTLPPVWHLFG